MLEGLEISELMLSQVLDHDKNFRIESEFFLKKYLKLKRKLTSIKTTNLNTLSLKITDGTHYKPNYTQHGVPFLSALNVIKNDLNLEAGYKFISQSEHKLLYKRCNPEPYDILLRKVGVGARHACVIPENCFEFSLFVSVALIKLDLRIINPFYIATFINSKLGQLQLFRLNKGVSQPDLHLEEIQKLEVPILSNVFQISIETLIKNARRKIEDSKSIYYQAETLLLRKLGIANFELSKQHINVKLFKESFLETGRLDAEYYQVKYEEMMNHLLRYNHQKLSQIVTIQKSIETGSDAYTEEASGFPYLRVADYNKFGLNEPQKRLSDDFYKDNFEKIESLKPKAETILFSKDGSVGEAYCLKEDANFITSGAILHLNILNKKTVLPEYLTLVLNSICVKMQSERDSGGSIILHWRISEIENVIVPILDITIQQQIAEFIEESFKLKAESERLLEVAKRAVEIAIEINEEAAMDFIQQTQSI